MYVIKCVLNELCMPRMNNKYSVCLLKTGGEREREGDGVNEPRVTINITTCCNRSTLHINVQCRQLKAVHYTVTEIQCTYKGVYAVYVINAHTHLNRIYTPIIINNRPKLKSHTPTMHLLTQLHIHIRISTQYTPFPIWVHYVCTHTLYCR